MKRLSPSAKAYITASILAAVGMGVFAFRSGPPVFSVRFLLYFAAAFAAAGLRVTLPGISSGISVNFVFLLIGLIDLSFPQMICLGIAGTLGQFVLTRRPWRPVQLTFNLSIVTLATAASYLTYHAPLIRSLNDSIFLLLLWSSTVMFCINTWLVSGIVALTEKKTIWIIWKQNYLWTASHHLVGAAVAAIFHYEEIYVGWEAVVLTAPVVYFVYRSYSLHLSRLQEAKLHASELGDLHWRAIEALALAIDAKDETTHNHLLRVKIYANEIGKELNMGETEMQALQAAALLHDIGKLAVPEHIISKPGKLTPEEFEKMKIHPVVGAEILERIRFPYPVVPIVRSHHEKWNGQGYPDGLAGEDIPLGARILSAVDCLDALASDRQYRRALPLDKAMDIVSSEAGKSFDPRIVAILRRRYVELEKLATTMPEHEEPKLSKNVKIERGGAPAAGFEETAPRENSLLPLHYMLASASARREFQNLVQISRDLAASATGDEVLALLTARLRRFIPSDATVIYVKEGGSLTPRFASGDDGRLFSAIRVGDGLSGWVAENHKGIINGNPAMEAGYSAQGRLKSTLAIPLESEGVVRGVLALHSITPACFNAEDQRTLLSVAPEILEILERASSASVTLPPLESKLGESAFSVHLPNRGTTIH